MDSEKIDFFKRKYIGFLGSIDPVQKPNWGKMNFQQMVEHMSDSFRIANGKDLHQLHTPVDAVEKFKSFAMSDKAFKENTKNALLPEEPALIRNKNSELAISELQTEINDFFSVFHANPSKTITNPFFGDLNFGEWVHLLHKHAVHHLIQFRVNL